MSTIVNVREFSPLRHRTFTATAHAGPVFGHGLENSSIQPNTGGERLPLRSASGHTAHGELCLYLIVSVLLLLLHHNLPHNLLRLATMLAAASADAVHATAAAAAAATTAAAALGRPGRSSWPADGFS